MHSTELANVHISTVKEQLSPVRARSARLLPQGQTASHAQRKYDTCKTDMSGVTQQTCPPLSARPPSVFPGARVRRGH